MGEIASRWGGKVEWKNGFFEKKKSEGSDKKMKRVNYRLPPRHNDENLHKARRFSADSSGLSKW